MRLNERRRYNTHYEQITMGWERLREGGGWPALAAIPRGNLLYLHHRVTPIGVTAVFQVLP